MENELLVSGLDGGAHVEEQPEALLDARRLGVAVIEERRADDVLEDEVGETVGCGPAVQEARDIRVLQPGEDLPLAAEAPDGLQFAGDGPQPRVVPWLEGTTFKAGTRVFTFRRTGDSGPYSELRVSAGAGYYILKRQ